MAGPQSRFSFFNGLGATSKDPPFFSALAPAGTPYLTFSITVPHHLSFHFDVVLPFLPRLIELVFIPDAVFYDVYTKLAELNLADIGLDVRWIDVDVAAVQGEDRWGKTREYFGVRMYRMPVGSLKAE